MEALKKEGFKSEEGDYKEKDGGKEGCNRRKLREHIKKTVINSV